ncbi:MAG: GAF domain-containing protein [Chloroflexi bacterium]|nr:MAG: GAF domain-containing protein [Chloroflexota bacterium]
MNVLRPLLTIPHQYTNPLDQQRAKALHTTMLLSCLLAIAVFMVEVFASVSNLTNFSDEQLFVVLASLPLILFVMMLIRRGYLNPAVNIILFDALLLVLLIGIVSGFRTTFVIMLSVPVILAGMFSSRRGLLIITLLDLLILLIITRLEFGDFGTVLSTSRIGIIFALIIIVIIFYVFMGNLSQFIEEKLVEVAQFRVVGQFSSGVEHHDENTVYAYLIRLIRDDLGYSFAQIFLIDATGQIARRIRLSLSQGDEVTVAVANIGDANALADAARSKSPVLVSSADSLVRRGHFLPSSNYGVALPIVVQDQVIGVLDVQSNQEPFSQNRVRVLQTLVTELSTILQDVRQIRALRESLEAQQEVNEMLRKQLQEYKQYERQVISSVWDEYFTSRGTQAVGFNWHKDMNVIPAADLPSEISSVLQQGEPTVMTNEKSQQVIGVPIQLRGELLGAMVFTMPPNTTVTDRQIEIAQNVTNRLILALENKRLFEQSQSQALRERKANEVASLLIGATNVSDVLDLAAERFNAALGAITTNITLELQSLSSETSSGEQPS